MVQWPTANLTMNCFLMVARPRLRSSYSGSCRAYLGSGDQHLEPPKGDGRFAAKAMRDFTTQLAMNSSSSKPPSRRRADAVLFSDGRIAPGLQALALEPMRANPRAAVKRPPGL